MFDRISPYGPADQDSIVALQQLLWHGGSEGNGAYLSWKYSDNPYLDHRYVLLAWQGTALVGMVGAFGALWEVPGVGRTMLPCLADTVIVPSHRGRAMFRAMLDELTARMAADGVPWLLDFGDQPAGPAMLMQGWKSIGPWSVLRLTRDPREWNEGPWPISGHTTGTRSGLSVQCKSQVDTKVVAALIAAVEPADRVRRVRDATYLKWRFRNPLASYAYLSAADDKLRGYLVVHRTRTDALWGETPTTIMDCEAADDAVWADLVETASAVFPGRELLMWARDIEPTRLGLLNELSFTIKAPTGRLTADVDLPNLLVRSTGAPFGSEAVGRLSRPDRWDLRSVCGRSWR